MSNKKTFDFDILGLSLALFLCMAFVLTGFMLYHDFYGSKNIASADSTNGVVEDNILFNTDFANFDNLIVNSPQYTFVDGYSPLRFKSSGTWGYVAERHPLSFYDMTGTITFTVRIRSVGGQTVYVGGRTYNSSGNSVASLGTRNTSSQSFVNLSITYDLSTIDTSGVSYLGFCYYCNGSSGMNNYCEIEWVKVEYSSSFTGYVPKDYTNYGYNQGISYVEQYNDFMVQDNLIRSSFVPNDVNNNYYLEHCDYRDLNLDCLTFATYNFYSSFKCCLPVDIDSFGEYTFAFKCGARYGSSTSYKTYYASGALTDTSSYLSKVYTNVVSQVDISVYLRYRTYGSRTGWWLEFICYDNHLLPNSYLLIEWAKVEQGSVFTGFVPYSYNNYGYYQGFFDGVDASIEGSQYHRIDFINYDDFVNANGTFSTNFTYNNKQYKSSIGINWKTVNQNAYDMYSLIASESNTYAGVKYSNENLYGNILIQFAWTTNPSYEVQIVFVDTKNNDTLVVTSDDTVHWSYLRDLGYCYDSGGNIIETAYLAQITYYSENPVDVYFLPVQPVYYQSNTHTLYLDFPAYNTPSVIYASQNGVGVVSSDEAYRAGYRKAQEQYADLLNNAKNSAWIEGKNYGMANANKYTFAGLLGSVVEAPLTALFGKTYAEDVKDQYGNVIYQKGVRYGGLFNVEILGVDMTSFFTALLSLMLVIGVVRIALKVAR